MSESSDERDDAALLAAAGLGDARAFERLYRRHEAWAFGVAQRFAPDRDEAADVVQEAFLHLLSKLPGFELRARFRTWLYPVLKHLARDRRVKRRPEALPSEGVLEPEARTAPSGDDEEVRSVLAALPEGQREVLLLRFVDDLSLAEIALALELPLGTVKSRLFAATRALRANPRSERLGGP